MRVKPCSRLLLILAILSTAFTKSIQQAVQQQERRRTRSVQSIAVATANQNIRSIPDQMISESKPSEHERHKITEFIIPTEPPLKTISMKITNHAELTLKTAQPLVTQALSTTAGKTSPKQSNLSKKTATRSSTPRPAGLRSTSPRKVSTQRGVLSKSHSGDKTKQSAPTFNNNRTLLAGGVDDYNRTRYQNVTTAVRHRPLNGTLIGTENGEQNATLTEGLENVESETQEIVDAAALDQASDDEYNQLERELEAPFHDELETPFHDELEAPFHDELEAPFHDELEAEKFAESPQVELPVQDVLHDIHNVEKELDKRLQQKKDAKEEARRLNKLEKAKKKAAGSEMARVRDEVMQSHSIGPGLLDANTVEDAVEQGK